jgi:hypothetical protein
MSCENDIQRWFVAADKNGLCSCHGPAANFVNWGHAENLCAAHTASLLGYLRVQIRRRQNKIVDLVFFPRTFSPGRDR